MSLFDQLVTLEDVERLIASGLRESETLEYKRAFAKLEARDHTEVARDLSAFANSAGGLILYGIATAKEDKTRPERIEQILAANVETVLQVAATHVRHPIPGLRHKTIPATGAPHLLLVDVPASAIAPHQVVTDHRYYRRNGVRNESMPHDLVELFFARRGRPELQPRITSQMVTASSTLDPLTIRAEIAILNRGPRLARDVFTWLELPSPVLSRLAFTHWHMGGHGVEGINRPGASAYAYRFRDRLCYPGLPQPLVTITLTLVERQFGPEFPVGYLDIYAEDVSPRRHLLFTTLQNVEMAPQLTWADGGLPPTP